MYNRKSHKSASRHNIALRKLTGKIGKVCLFLIVLISLVGGSTISIQAADVITFTGEELLGKPTDTSITVNIVPNEEIEYYYEFGSAPGTYTGQTTPVTAAAGQPHEVVISGLAPNTKYYYRMRYHAPGDGDDWVNRDEHSFHTQRTEGSTFVFTVTSDSHAQLNAEHQQAMVNVLADEPDFHLDLGDTFYVDNKTSQAQVDANYLAYRNPLYMGKIGPSVPIFLTAGNHENEEGWNLDDTPFSIAVGSIQARKAYYPTPIDDSFYSGNTDTLAAIDEGTYGDEFREDYYAWEWGDALFVVLDEFQYTMELPYTPLAGEGSDDAVTGDQWSWTLGLEQYNWFKGVLENSDAKYKFVFSHNMVGGVTDVSGGAGGAGYVRGGAGAAPYFEWGGKNADGTWGFDDHRPGWGGVPIHQLMVENGVSAYFHGHDHQFVYEKLDGIVYQEMPSPSMTGSGFSGIYDLNDSYTIEMQPNSGHLRIEVTPDVATVDYVRSNQTGSTYTYTIEPNSPPEEGDPLYRVNAGGPDIDMGAEMDFSGITSSTLDAIPGLYAHGDFAADVTITDVIDMSGVDPDLPESLFQSLMRTGTASGEVINYDFDVPNGDYNVYLHWAEHNSSYTDPGDRVFDVFVEGVEVLPDYDIIVASGAEDKAVTEIIATTVTDDVLSISIAQQVSVAIIRGIEIVPVGDPAPDTTPPEITLVGDAEISVEQGEAFVDPGATAEDNRDGDISGDIVVGGDVVNTNVLGDYVITYNVSDDAGNPAVEVTRTVHVVEPATILYRVNAGGPDIDMGAEMDFSGITSTTLDAIPGLYAHGDFAADVTTTDVIDMSGVDPGLPESLFQSLMRTATSAGETLYFDFDVPNGDYNVHLHWAEHNSSTAQIGAREFDVSLEGTLVFDNYDIFEASGAEDKAVTEIVPVTVTDGVLNLSIEQQVSVAIIRGIEIERVVEPPTTYELTTAVSPASSGTINPAAGVHTYNENYVVTVSASPESGYLFDHWEGACTGSGACQVTMDADKAVTAYFVEEPPGSIVFVGDIGSQTSKTTGTTLAITTTAGVAGGDDIIVAFATSGDPDYAISITDDAGNTYEEAAQAVTYAHGRTYVFAAYDVTALPAGSQITITHTSVAARSAVASVFRGLANVDPLDQSLGNPVPGAEEEASGTTASVGPTGTTVRPCELLIGAVGTEGPVTDTAGTWDNSFIAGPRAGTTGDEDDSNWTISMGYRIVNQVGEYTAQKSGMTDRYWAAGIATFKSAPSGVTYDLTMAVDPMDSGTTDPAIGIHTYEEYQVVNVSASPAPGYVFDHWSGACTGSGACQVTMSEDLAVTAHFVAETYTLTVNVTGSGSVGIDPLETSYNYGDEVELTATADANWYFVGWSGDLSGSDNPDTITMDGDKTVTATFAEIAIPEYNIVLGRPTDDSVTVNAVLSVAGQVYFEYGTESGVYTNQTGTLNTIADEPVETVIDGLSVDTAYFYRMVYSADGSTWISGEEFTFHTQRDGSEPFVFTITSDSHLGQDFSGNEPARYLQTTLNVADDNPDFHIDLGDAFIMDWPTNQSEANDVYLTQRPYFGNFGNSAPVYLVIGNHENEEGWNFDDTPFSKALGSVVARKAYFPNPIPDDFYTGNEDTLTAIGGDQLREDYYAWEWGNALFVVLDPFQYTMTKPYDNVMGSGEDDDESVSGDQWNWTLGLEQYEWFKEVLESSDAEFKFVFSHHIVGGQLEVSGAAGVAEYVRGGAMAAPYFEWGGDNENGIWSFPTKRSGWGGDPLQEIMVDNGVTAFFHGHDHQFVHEVRDGIIYQLVPSAGMTGYGFDLYADSPYVVSGGNLPNAGHVRVTVSDGETLVEYVRSAISGDTGVTNGEIAYSYSIEPSFTLTTLVDPDDTGTVDPGVGNHSYPVGELVTVTATPAEGYVFDQWSGDCTGSGECQLTMDCNKSVTAHFVVAEYTLTVSKVGSGTVDVDPEELTYAYGDEVELTATPEAGWLFAGWSGDISSTDNPITVTIEDDTNITATFTQDAYTLTVSEVGSGSVEIDPEQLTYEYGDEVELTATPAPGWTFTGWSGDASGSDNPLTVTMDCNKAITATFIQDEYTLTVSKVGSGTVDVDPELIIYHYGDEVELTATPAPGWTFTGWSGDASGSDNPLSFTMDCSKAITATFTQDEYTLTVSKVGSGTVDVDPLMSVYHYGNQVELTANPAIGWNFAGWSGDVSSTENPLTVTIDGNVAITATFIQDAYTVTVSEVGSGSVEIDPDQLAYTYGDQVELTAVPVTGWQFDGWSGDISSTENPLTVTIDGSIALTATFSEIPIPCYALTLSHIGQGSDPTASPTHSATCALGEYAAGEKINLSSAVAASGWHIASWTGTDDDILHTSSNILTMPAKAHNVSVTYELMPDLDAFHGNAVITADQPIVAIPRPHMNKEIMAYNGLNEGSKTVYLPMLFNGIWGYTSTFTLQNAGETSATYNIIFKDADNGSTSCVINGETLIRHLSKTYDMTKIGTCDIGSIPNGWVGSATITSDEPLVAVVNPHIEGSDVVSYNGFTGGADVAYLPMLFRGIWGYESAFYVQNLDNTQDANITIELYDALGNFTCSYQDTTPIAPNVTRGYWLGSIKAPQCVGGAGFPAEGWAGSAVVKTGTGSSEIVAIGRPHMGKEVAAYNGFTQGSTTNYLPMLFRGMWGYQSAFYIQNISDDEIDIEINFYDVNGDFTCSYADPAALEENATRGYWLSSLNCNDGRNFSASGWAGSAKIMTSGEAITVGRPHLSDGQVVTYDGYSGGSETVFVPLLYRQYNNNESALYIQNLGTEDAHVTITYFDEQDGYYCAMGKVVPSTSSGAVWLAGIDTTICMP